MRRCSHARDHLAGERLRDGPLLGVARGEHQLLKALPLEVADPLDQLVGRAYQAGGADQVGVDQLALARMNVRVVVLVGPEVTERRGRLLDERSVSLPYLPEKRRRIDADLIRATCLVGTADELIERIRDLERQGLQELMFATGTAEKWAVAESFARQVIARM